MERGPACQCNARGQQGLVELMFFLTTEDRFYQVLSPRKQLEGLKLQVGSRK